MTAEQVEDVTLRMPWPRGWTGEDLPGTRDDGHRYETVNGSMHVSASPTPHQQVAAHRPAVLLSQAAAGEPITVDVPFPVEVGRRIRPARS
jgi:hypothetical protein